MAMPISTEDTNIGVNLRFELNELTRVLSLSKNHIQFIKNIQNSYKVADICLVGSSNSNTPSPNCEKTKVRTCQQPLFTAILLEAFLAFSNSWNTTSSTIAQF